MALYNPDFGGSASEAVQKQTCSHTGQAAMGSFRWCPRPRLTQSGQGKLPLQGCRAAAVELWAHNAESIHGSSGEGSAKDRMALSS